MATYTKRPGPVGRAFSDRKLSQCRMRLRARIRGAMGFSCTTLRLLLKTWISKSRVFWPKIQSLIEICRNKKVHKASVKTGVRARSSLRAPSKGVRIERFPKSAGGCGFGRFANFSALRISKLPRSGSLRASRAILQKAVAWGHAFPPGSGQ